MARKKEPDKPYPLLNILYIAAVALLTLSLILMYSNYRHKKAAFNRMVQQAIQVETLTELLPKEDIRDLEDDGLG